MGEAEGFLTGKARFSGPTVDFHFLVFYYGTKATDEEDYLQACGKEGDPPASDEFQQFIHTTPTTVAKNDTL